MQLHPKQSLEKHVSRLSLRLFYLHVSIDNYLKSLKFVDYTKVNNIKNRTLFLIFSFKLTFYFKPNLEILFIF
jgi:hypothetical protein